MSIPMEIEFQSHLNDDEQKRLVSYLRRNERMQPIAFEGRHDIRKHIKEQITAVRESPEPICSTVVVQGAPGAGKTSLLRQIKHDVLNMPNSGDIIPILIEIEQFNDPMLLLEKFLDHGKVNYESISKSYSEDGKGTFNLSVLKFEGGIQAHLPALDTRVRESPGRIWNVIRQSLYPGDDPIFILLVDESQRVKPNDRDTNTLLANIHGAINLAGLRIIPVFAGLSDTDDALSQVGITREACEDFILDSLSPDEGARVVLSSLNALGLKKLFYPEDKANLVHQISIAGDVWPRHIHSYLHALVAEIVLCQKEGRTHIDMDKVLDEGHDERISYYFRRLKRIKGYDDLHKHLDALALKYDIGAEMETGAVFDSFQNASGANRNDVNGMIDACVHNGIFRKFENGNYGFAIPSLHTFLATGRNPEITKELLRTRFDGDTGGGGGALGDGHMKSFKRGSFD
ncbi:MAG: ATP-binding protein [Gammaproteobacteria bacterium]|nr:ATP-binding protein [Gammaproteobacteria bacterium]